MGRARGWGRQYEMRLTYNGTDRISDLPDPILGEILSRLPVKSVIATSVLSTRWKTLFPSSVSLTELELDDSDVLHRYNRWNNSDSFINFVDKLLNVTLRDASCVEKVALRCENEYGDVKICSWVCAALRLNVQHLRLMSSMSASVRFFNSLHGCTTLAELALGFDFMLELPGEFTLPNLKRLSLYGLSFRDDVESVRELIAGCLVLNDLRILNCDLSDLDNLYIRHPFITNLIIETSDFYGGQCRVVIDAPNVETFVHKGYCVSKYACENVKSLHSVDFDFCLGKNNELEYPSQCRRLAKLVKACSRTKHLCLSGKLLMALYDSCILLPTFQNLTRLTISHMESGGWKMLARFLEIAPSLEVLTFPEGFGGFMRAYEDFDSQLPSVPTCLDLCLKKIEIWKFEGTPFEVKLLGCFLKNGRVLQELIVHCLPCEITRNIAKLSVLPRHSEACKVLVMEGKYPGDSRFSHNS